MKRQAPETRVGGAQGTVNFTFRHVPAVRAEHAELTQAVREMAQCTNEAIGVDMANAVTDASQFMRDQAAETAEAIRKKDEDARQAVQRMLEDERDLANERNRNAAGLRSQLVGGGLSASLPSPARVPRSRTRPV